MAYQLNDLACGKLNLDDEQLRRHVESLLNRRRHYARLWAYYRNPMRVVAVDSDDSGSHRPYRQAQEWGLPSRITGIQSGCDILSSNPSVDGVARKEIVIENDIAWRIDTMVDFLFGRSITLASTAPDERRRTLISRLLRLILAHNGGITFLQQLALLGGVYGFVDVLVKFNPRAGDAPACARTQPLGQPPLNIDDLSSLPPDGSPPSKAEPAPSLDEDSTDPCASDETSLDAQLERIARMVRLEIVEPARALPLLSPDDYRVVLAYAQCYEIWKEHAVDGCGKTGWAGKLRRSARGLLRRLPGSQSADVDDRALIVELLTPNRWQRYQDETLIEQGVNSLGRLPLVHVQNTAVPFEYSGASDVEPMMPLQDELNTRLSDRANRITLQSFKMYLGKGIEGFANLPVAPGRMWMTDNDNADVIEFGGDASSPSEDAHINEIREAMDKTSGVTPIAAGAIKGRIGRLTSAAALRVTMQALLAKTEKKRTTYGDAIARLCELSLAWLDCAGVFRTTSDERHVELHWPSPIPENDLEKLQEAQAKARLGVPKEVLLRELGY